MKRALILVIAFLFIPMVANADLNSHRKAAEELLLMTNTTQRLEISKKQVRESYARMMNAFVDNNYSQKDADAFANKLSDMVDKEFTWDKLKDKYIDIYIEAFSEQEMTELKSFYKSPIGQKLIEKMPLLTQRFMEITQTIAMNLMKEIKTTIEQNKEQKSK